MDLTHHGHGPWRKKAEVVMRYEDASHTGAFQGSQPVANDDLDSIPAGSRTPATGNLISGEGTQTGSAGADVAAGAHVAAIAGKGGEDSSFAGGKLSVSGEYGQLSVDKDGNYSYQANKGVENVRDRFTYTLADNTGATDTGALIVEIGKTPVVIKANAQQIVPGPDGVVTLPPGVELSDIMVVGRNLVINMPDGTQMIIVDGAIFVPQLQLGGVEVPATNLAALLIGQEPQPAAGEAPQSSGGNFETPVPPLDPGVPLGDLIPPTEYVYQPPEPQPPLLPLEDDEVPTIQIQPDGQPASVNAVDLVDEDGLPARNGGEPEGSDEGADGNPSNNSDTDETTAGTIIVDSPDGVGTVTINGVLVTGAIGQVINGEFGTLTITGFNGSNILYSYTLTDNTSGDNTHDDFTVVLTDPDGDTATATLTIDIIDDVPTARDDTDAVVKGATSTDGNVLTGVGTTSGAAGSDTSGADALPNGVTGVHAGTTGSFAVVTSGGVLVHCTFGDLLIHADGSYTYTSNGQPGPGGNDVYTYQVTDGDGDTDTATLTINVPADSIPVAINAAALVDDDGLPLGNHDSAPGDDTQSPDPDADESTFGGTVTANFGTDGPGTFTLGSDMDGKVVTIGQEEVTYHVVGNVLTAEVSDGARAGTDLFTVTLNADGSYTVQLLNNVLQVDDGTNTENNATASITFTAHDSDGDVGNGTLTITLDDDIPVAKPPIPPEEGGDPTPLVTGLVDEDDLPAGIGDNAPGDDDPGNADGDNDGTTAGGGAGSLAGLFNAGADAPLTFSLSNVTSGLPTLHSAGALVTYSVAGNVLTASANGSTVFTLTVNADGSWTFDLEGQLDHPTAGTEDNLLLDLSSVIVATDSDGDSVGAAGGVFVINVDDDLPIALEERVIGTVDEDGVPGGIAGGVGDVAGESAVANGSVASLFASGADVPLTFSLLGDTSGLPALTSGGAAVSYAVVGNTLTASAGGHDVFTFVLNADGSYTFTLLDQLDHPAGSDENDLNISLGSIIQATDADGDSAAADDNGLVITVDDDTPVATQTLLTGTVDEDGVPGGIAGGPDDVAGADTVASGSVATLFASGADQPLSFSLLGDTSGLPALTSGGAAVTYSVVGNTLTASAGGHDVFTFVLNANGSYTFTLLDQLDHPTLNGQPGDDTENELAIQLGSIIQATDADGDSVAANGNGLVITVDDDTPVANNDTDTIVGGNGPATGNVITGIDFGGGDANGTDGTADQVGADAPATITFIASNNVPANTDGTYTAGNLVVAGQYGVLTINANGNYSYLRNDGTPGGVSDTFTYTLTDADGDSVTATLTIGIDDNFPTAGNVNAVVDDDNAVGVVGNPGGPNDDAPSNASGNLPGSGGDGALTFDLLLTGAPAGFTYVDGPAGSVLVQQGGTTVLTITINPATGAYTITENAPIVHPSLDGAAGDNTENNVSFTINYTVTDADGDPANGTLNISVDDDTPVATATLLTGTVDEDGVLEGAADAGQGDGIAGGTGDVAGQSVTASGSVATLFSAGADTPLTYSLLTNTGGLPALTSGGVPVTYAVVGNTLTASAGVGNTVFTFVLNADGSYTFTLVDQLDHAAGGGENDLNIALGSIIQATDHDGDSVTANANGLVITVDDDSPIATQTQLTGTVDEDGVREGASDPGPGDGIAGGTGDVAGESVVASGSVATLFQSGADEPLTYSLSAITAGLPALTSGGVPVTYAVVGNTLSASAGVGNTVFTFVLNANGSYTFTLVDQLDHAAGGGENDLSIALGSIIQATDFDGDTVSANANGLVITVDDDSPTLGTIQDQEASNVPGDPVSIGTLHFEVGADEAAIVTAITADNSGITSGGKALVTNVVGNVLTAYQDANSNGVYDAGDTTAVYTLTVNPNAGTSGQYVFDLLTSLDPTVTDTPIGGSSSFGAGPTLGQILEDVGGADLSVVSGYTTTASFNFNTWFAGGALSAATVDPAGVNGSTSGWGVEDNNFGNQDEIFFFDFGSQPLSDPDGGDAFTPPATTLPNISTATFDFINYTGAAGNAGDDIAYVVHFTDGTSVSGFIPDQFLDGSSHADATNWKFTAPAGKFIADIQFYSGVNPDGSAQDLPPGKVDLVSVGIQTSSLDETIDFNVTITDHDGDPVSGGFSVNVSDGNTPVAPEALVVQSQSEQLQKSAANSNTLTLAAAVAAAGVVETQAAAAPAHDNGNHHKDADVDSVATHQASVAVASDDSGSSVVSDEAPEAANDSAPVDSSSHQSAPEESDHALDDGSAKADAQSNDHPVANDEGPAQVSADASPVAPTVAMVSAEALKAAGVAGHDQGVAGQAQHGGSVEQIVAEALGHGNASAAVDALLNALPGGHGAVAALANVASPAANAVPGGDMLGLGAFAPGHDMMMNMHVAMHHDAVQPVANG
jgi:T1SS-143 domain-containing protein